jgi:hypothetical protein
VVLGPIAVVSAVGAAWVVLRWWRTGADFGGRRPPKPWWGAGTLCVVFLVTGGLAWRDARREARLSDVASSLAGRPVKVRCQSWLGSFGDANVEPGYVRWQADGSPEASTTLKADVCRSLGRYLRDPHGAPTAVVIAVHIVSHEAMHMAGRKDEAAAECAAVQRDALTARLLGADAGGAAALAHRYWTEVYPRMPGEYRSAACTPGGPLDERLGDGPWPGTGG